jgi:hypothetical protein
MSALFQLQPVKSYQKAEGVIEKNWVNSEDLGNLTERLS